MRLSLTRFATALLVLLGLWSAASAGDGADQNVRGVVTDESSGVLPGVTVTVRAIGGGVLATTVTDGQGRYVLGPLAAGPVIVTFYLEGFSPAAVRVAIGADVDAVANQRLVVAPQSETVTVVGRVPVPRPLPSPSPPRARPRPKPVTAAVPEHDKASICGPAKLGAVESFGTIRSRRYAANALYAEGDELVSTAARSADSRSAATSSSAAPTASVGASHGSRRAHRRSRQIVSADEFSSVAVVIYACDEMLQGDRLASFKPEPPAPAPARHARLWRAAGSFPDVGTPWARPGRAGDRSAPRAVSRPGSGSRCFAAACPMAHARSLATPWSSPSERFGDHPRGTRQRRDLLRRPGAAQRR